MSIQIVIVTYKTMLSECVAYNTFCQYVHSLTVPYSLLIYNNSPENKITCDKEYVEVVDAVSNDMLAGAYNFALQAAVNKQAQWLLLLDQDTQLSQAYFEKLNDFLTSSFVNQYDVVVPLMRMRTKHLSPIAFSKKTGPFINQFNSVVNHQNFKKCTAKKQYAAFNSASLLSVKQMTSIGGFDTNYPLDMLDHRYYHLLNKVGAKLYVLDVVLSHSLSLLEKKNTMSKQRYKEYLDKCLMFAKTLGWGAVLCQKIRLSFSVLMNMLVPHKHQYFKASVKNLFRF